jgi:DNA polymerase-3 subunit alpha
MLAVRGAQRRITSLHTLCESIDLRLVNKRVLESLTKAGAFDGLATGPKQPPPVWRARLFAVIDRALEHGNRSQRDRDLGQSQLFADPEVDGDSGGIRLPEAPPWSDSQQLAYEKEALGLYLSGHPLDRFADDLRRVAAVTTIELANAEGDVLVGGIVSGCRPLKTRRGHRMAVFTLDDPLGAVEVVVFPEPFEKHASLVENDTMVIVRGKLERDEETRRILASELLPIQALQETLVRQLDVRLTAPPHDRRTFERLAELFARHRGDRPVTVELEVQRKDRPIRVRADLGQVRIKPSAGLIEEVERLCGQGTVSLR